MATTLRPSEGMTPARWQRVKLIAADALERDPALRSSFVVQACAGDATLQSEVDLLLAQDAQVFDHCAADTRTEIRTEGDLRLIGQRLGAYQVLSEIGRGGMGAVYLAARADGHFDKKVAIKLLKRGTDTDEVLRRFYAERQILARLEHPSIARLLDGGVTDHGLPYFVMEYVEGKPLTEFCRVDAPTIEERLRLFLKICAAVQFAHQNLIVHRDLKPGNILVTEECEPKLLDFGIAKLLSPGDDALSVTLSEHQRLTPAYASPEQVRGEPITTVSDIYTLGTLLYEMLTGQNAHRFSTPHPQPTELLRVVGQEELLRPSAAATDPAIKRGLRGDLDTIILKALRKEPARRYDGVASFSEDIRRHLNGLPVRARQDTAAYRTSKFMQRHKLGVAAAALVLLTLVGGVIGTTWQARKARQQKAIAEERFLDARELAHSILFDYHDAIASLPGATAVRERLVRDSLKYLDRLAHKAGNDLSLQQELAIAYIKVGDIQGRSAAASLGDAKGALESYQKALVISEKMTARAPTNVNVLIVRATNLERLGEISALSGNPANAVEKQRQSLALFEKLSAGDPADAHYQAAVANAHRMLAQVLGAPSVANIGDRKGALEHLQKAAAIYESLPEQDSSPDLKKHSDLFVAYIQKKYIQENLSNVYAEIGEVLEAMGIKKEALENRQKSATILRTLLASDPQNISVRRNLAVIEGNIANVFLSAGDMEHALARYQQSLALYEALVAEDPSDLNARKDLALGYRNMGKVLAESKDNIGASSYYHKAVEILESLVAKDPGNAFIRRHLAFTYLRISMLLSSGDDLSGAADQARKSISICESLIAADPKNSTARNTLALSYSQLGKTYSLLAPKARGAQRKENWQSAKDWYQKSLAIWQEMNARGTLSGADAGKPGELAKEIATCDAALNSTDLEKPLL